MIQASMIGQSVLRRTCPIALSLLQRQKGVTGFVTVAGLEKDPRSQVFARYHHIERVTRLADWQASRMIEQGCRLDVDRVVTLAMMHDINRLPFAHNIEGAVGFDQAGNIDLYFDRHELTIPLEWRSDLVAILKKQVSAMSPEAKVVFAADTADGYIEDPLLAITALGVSQDFVPAEVSARLGLPFADRSFAQRLAALTNLYQTRQPQRYVEDFGRLTHEFATAFLSGNNNGPTLFVEIDGYGSTKKLLREGFMNQQVFPINNGIVSQNKRLQAEIGKPLQEKLTDKHDGDGEAAHFDLLRLTDQQALELAASEGIITEENIPEYYPKLDYNA